jgi:serine/threonine protein kinase/tetratricopeptide (TPR) repeat protein
VILYDPGRSESELGSDAGRPAARSGPRSRGSQSDPVARLVEDFAAAWQCGERPPAEAFLDRHRLVSSQPEAAIRLIYEEVCLRQVEGEAVPLSELVERFPQWQAELELLLDCDRLISALPTPPTFPEIGEPLGDFLLMAELGRGARGRCFLATQPSLSYRQVVLKVTPDDHVEHLSMARLQHTHIMPLYSEHEFPDRRLRALCMPYLGGASLARLLDELLGLPADRLSGRSILEILDGSQQPSPWPQAGDSPARRFLAHTSYVRAVCWIGACLADALQYAHDRRLVHMDIKPSNILLTADGQPMLLDFHLATEPIAIGTSPDDGVGGTPGYMSPEQEAAIAAMDSGRAVRSGVDSRSDVYSLGRVLAEMLGAGSPATADPATPRRRPSRPEISTGLADIVGKCVAVDPDGRYPDAASLAEDLRRHMADLPLHGVANRSLTERWRKWRRRRPGALFRVQALLLASCLAATPATFAWFAFLAPRFRGAAHALVEGRVRLGRGDYPEAARALTRGAALIEGLPGGERLSGELAEALRSADRLEEADRLHRLVDRLRLAESAADRSVQSAREVERHCRMLWRSRRSLLARPGTTVDPRIEEQLRDDLLDLALIGTSLRPRLETEPGRAAEAHRAGLETLEEAEALFGPSHVLYRARQAHATALGLSNLADEADGGALRMPPRTGWEHVAAGRVLLAAGDIEGAEAAFERALAVRPQDFWPNFHQGVCAYHRGRFQDAVNAFRVCIALAPDRAEGFYNRALAHSAQGHADEADQDFRRAVTLDPTLSDSPLGREMSLRSKAQARAGRL